MSGGTIVLATARNTPQSCKTVAMREGGGGKAVSENSVDFSSAFFET